MATGTRTAAAPPPAKPPVQMALSGGALVRPRPRWDAIGRAVTPPIVAVAAIGLAVLVTEQLAARSVFVAAALALLVVLPTWLFFSSSYRVTLAVLMLYLGCVDGVLKLTVNTQAATLGRDVLFYSIVLGALARFAVGSRPLRIPPLTGYVLAFVVIVLVQLLNPGTGSIGHGLAALRPHLEFVPLFFFGYYVMREPHQLRLFLLLLCVVAAANGIVSVVQFNLSPAQLASWGHGYHDRIYGIGVSARSFSVGGGSTAYNRPFGLGPDIGFGGFTGVLAVPAWLALLGTARRRWAGRVGAPLGVGILLAVATSQQRTAVLAAVVALIAFGGLAIASGHRAAGILGLAAVVALAVGIVSTLTAGSNSAALSRYNDIAPSRVLNSTFAYRQDTLQAIPGYMTSFPLGKGLGHVGPATGLGKTDAGSQGSLSDALNGESQFTFLLVELGIAGLLVFGALHLRLLALAARVPRVRDREVRLLLAGCAAPLFALAATWIAGPISATTPSSPFFWFTAGILAFWLYAPGQDRHSMPADQEQSSSRA